MARVACFLLFAVLGPSQLFAQGTLQRARLGTHDSPPTPPASPTPEGGPRQGTDTPRAGFNFLYSADLYPIKPLILSASLDLGNLDNAFVVHGRGTVGVNLGHWEAFVGYDFLRVGGVNLQGPLAGVRFWF